jgi:alpha-tubulin suppressor-like RCC1 family protein
LNNRGQLGDDSTTNSSSPVLVSGLFGEGLVVAGARHTCWLQVSSGTVRCWGRNDHGQLGDGTNTDRSIGSMEVVDLRASSLAAGLHHTCAIDSGDLFCWGLNEDGQLGDGTTTSRNQPTRVLGIDEVTAVAAGSHHTCAVRSDGSAWCWGDNEHGQLGDGSTTTRYEPVRVAW